MNRACAVSRDDGPSGGLVDGLEAAATALRAAKRSIRFRFAALNLTEAEVQGLVVVAFYVSAWGAGGEVSVKRTVERWRFHGRVDEEWLTRQADRPPPRLEGRTAAEPKEPKPRKTKALSTSGSVERKQAPADPPKSNEPQRVYANSTAWNWWQR